MKKIVNKVVRFLSADDGPAAVEYAVLLALLVGMMVASIIYVGDEARQMSDVVVDGMSGAIDSSQAQTGEMVNN